MVFFFRYTLLLFLFEYRAATLLIQRQFPGQAAASITKFEVDGDVISLDGHDMPLRTESETDDHGRIRVRIRRSVSSAPESSCSIGNAAVLTPRPSNLSNADIFSINTPLHLHDGDPPAGASPHLSGYASSDAYSLQPTPRASNFNEMEAGTPVWGCSPVTAGRVCLQSSPVARVVWESPGKCGRGEERQGCKDITLSDKEMSFRDSTKVPDPKDTNAKEQKMPHAFVMMRLILVVVGRKLSRNPNTYSSVLGLLWSLVSFKWNMEMPSLIKSSVKIISDAGLGMAMFSLGLFMALQPRIIACGTKRAVMGMLIRFLCGPLVMSASSIAIGLRHDILHTAIVQGIVPFVFAREYGLHPDILSTGVIFANWGKLFVLLRREGEMVHYRDGLHKSEQLSATRDQDDDSNVLIECRDVYKSFGEKKILNGVSFKVMGFVLDNGFGYITLLVMEEKTRDFRESGGLVFFFALSGFWELQVKEGDRARRFTVVFWMLFGFLLGISAKSKSIRFFSDINLLSSFGNKILQPRVPFQL
ncbi:Auxin efflux carrier component 6 [Vigna angularis]|uniref:Auxin efflux carrier component 6 n=1 Tax=Phaseolus angularis TaxID=3914 RepID=A0A8T0JYS4_PHAAN|nr:Auxin efflux carrier component 6 [Vigna angularis]